MTNRLPTTLVEELHWAEFDRGRRHSVNLPTITVCDTSVPREAEDVHFLNGRDQIECVSPSAPTAGVRKSRIDADREYMKANVASNSTTPDSSGRVSFDGTRTRVIFSPNQISPCDFSDSGCKENSCEMGLCRVSSEEEDDAPVIWLISKKYFSVSLMAMQIALRILILLIGVCGVVLLLLGLFWSEHNRDFLVAGTLLTVVSLGVSMQTCLRRNPHRVPIEPRHILGDPLLNDLPSLAIANEEASTLLYPGSNILSPVSLAGKSDAKGERQCLPPQYLPLNLSGTAPSFPLYTHDSSTLTPASAILRGRPYLSGLSPLSAPGVSPIRQSGEIMNQQLRLTRRLSMLAHPQLLYATHSHRSLNHANRSTSHSVLQLARRLSTVGEVSLGTSFHQNPWNSRSHIRHKYRRSLSHPWEMARPERHYIEYE